MFLTTHVVRGLDDDSRGYHAPTMAVISPAPDVTFPVLASPTGAAAWPRPLPDGAHDRLGPGSWLLFYDGLADRAVPLHGPVVRIGRSLNSHVTLEGSSVSRRHTVLIAEGGRWSVADDRSLNGTWLNGELLGGELHALTDGDVLTVGSYTLHFATL